MADCAVQGESSKCDCDLGVGAWAMSAQRFLKVDFVAPFSNDSFQVVTRTSAVRNSSEKDVFFIQAFSLRVWGAILLLAVYHVIVKLFDGNFARPPPDSLHDCSQFSFLQRARHIVMKTKLLYRIRHGFFSTFLNLLGQTSTNSSTKPGSKQVFMNLVGLLFGVLLLIIYQSSVTVQVLVTVPQSPFASVADFKSCAIDADRVCLTGNGASENFWNKAIATEQYV